nr:immunoglobulin heavy chain junction region [Macaca mulatta]
CASKDYGRDYGDYFDFW